MHNETRETACEIEVGREVEQAGAFEVFLLKIGYLELMT